jgi:hypothetical protein
MEPNSTSATVTSKQMSTGSQGNLVQVTITPPALTSLSDEQNLFSVVSFTGSLTNPAHQSLDAIPPSDVVMEDSTSSVAFLPTGMNLPLPANPGFAVDSDGAPVASRKGTIMRPNPQSTTAR